MIWALAEVADAVNHDMVNWGVSLQSRLFWIIKQL
jgi:hypothetical protein